MLLNKEQYYLHILFIHFHPFENLCTFRIGTSALKKIMSPLSECAKKPDFPGAKPGIVGSVRSRWCHYSSRGKETV